MIRNGTQLKRRRHGFTLLELLLVVVLMGIFARLVIPNTNPSAPQSLEAAVHLLVNDLDYARCLAVTNNSNYRVALDATNHRWTLTHSGTNTSLNTLPSAPFHSPLDTSTAQVTALAEVPRLGAQAVQLYLATAGGATVTDIEFGPMGQTTRTSDTTVWLAVGTGTAARYQSLTVNAVTGLATMGSFTGTAPPTGSE